MQYFVAEAAGQIAGYIHWTQKSGFRPEVVLELEQLAVDPASQGQGIGRRLIVDSLPLVRAQLREREAHLKHVMVTTRTDNHAQELYRRTLGVEVEATLQDVYSGDEVIMIVRNLPE